MTVTREEFVMARDEIKALSARLDTIDQQGTRGVGAIAVQMTEVIKDVNDVRQELRDHRKEHEAENRARTTARRWAVGVGVTLFAAVESPLLVLLVTHKP